MRMDESSNQTLRYPLNSSSEQCNSQHDHLLKAILSRRRCKYVYRLIFSHGIACKPSALLPCQHSSTAATPKCNAQVQYSGRSDVPNFKVEILQFLLDSVVLLGHFFILLLPLITACFKSLDFAFVVAGLDVGLA